MWSIRFFRILVQEKESIMLSTFPVEMGWMMKAMILFLNRYVNMFIESQIEPFFYTTNVII